MDKQPLAIPFKYLNNDYNNLIKEFNIDYTESINDFDALITFIEYCKTNSIRVNIACKNDVSVEKLSILTKLYSEIYIRISPKDRGKVERLKEKGINFFFDSELSATNYTTLSDLISLGTSDVYVIDDLVYDMARVKKICEKNNVRLRLILNRIPSSSMQKGQDCITPIYRPQDLEVLKQYFDIFEFDCGEPYDWHKFNVYWRAWFERGRWHGNIKEINPDLKIDLFNDQLLPNFTENKMTCRRRCFSEIDYRCNRCHRLYNIHKTFLENGLYLPNDFWSKN